MTNQGIVKTAIEISEKALRILDTKKDDMKSRTIRKKKKHTSKKKSKNVTKTGNNRKEKKRKPRKGRNPGSKEDTKTAKDNKCDVCMKNKKGKDCWCIGTETPGQIPQQNTPKLVMVTFDDAVTSDSYRLFKNLFDGRTNPNGCPVTTTLFVSDIATNYDHVRDLYKKGTDTF